MSLISLARTARRTVTMRPDRDPCWRDHNGCDPSDPHSYRLRTLIVEYWAAGRAVGRAYDEKDRTLGDDAPYEDHEVWDARCGLYVGAWIEAEADLIDALLTASDRDPSMADDRAACVVLVGDLLCVVSLDPELRDSFTAPEPHDRQLELVPMGRVRRA